MGYITKILYKKLNYEISKTRLGTYIYVGSISIAPTRNAHRGLNIFLATAGGSNPAEAYPYGVLILLGSPNLYLT